VKIKETRCLVALLLLSAFPVYASDPTIKIGTIHVSPYGINQQEVDSGVYYELTNLIVANAGYTYSNKVTPYARIVQDIKFGKTDLTIIFKTPVLEGYVDYVVALPSKKVVAIGLQGSSFKDDSDLSGKKIVHIRGTKFNDQIDNDESIQKYQVSDYKRAVNMLIAGRADAIIGALPTIETAVLDIEKKEGKRILLNEPLIISVKTPWIQVSKKSRSYIDIEKLKQSFIQLQETNTYQKLQIKYHSEIGAQ